MIIKEKIQDYINYYRYIRPLKNTNSDFKKNIVAIFTNPRSGSTWLTNIIKASGNYVTIWEPLFKYNRYVINRFNPFAYPEIHNVGFAWNQPIPEDALWDEALLFFNKLLAQNILNLKIYRYNNLPKINKNNDLLVKFCFGNLLLPWFTKNFETKPILFVRHPAAVVLSQLKRWGYNSNYKKYKIGEFKFNELYKKYQTAFEKVSTPEEYLAAEWALTNIYPIKHKNNNKKWLTVAYENILLYPDKELKRISEFLETKFPENIAEKMKQPSFTTDNLSVIDKERQLSKWKSELSEKQKMNIFNIIKHFGVDFYTDNIFPVNEIIYNL